MRVENRFEIKTKKKGEMIGESKIKITPYKPRRGIGKKNKDLRKKKIQGVYNFVVCGWRLSRNEPARLYTSSASFQDLTSSSPHTRFFFFSLSFILHLGLGAFYRLKNGFDQS